MNDLPNFKYELEKKEPRLGSGGITRGVSVKEFKASENRKYALRSWSYQSGLYEGIDLSSWIAGNPKDILKGNFGVGNDIIDQFPKSGQLIIK